MSASRRAFALRAWSPILLAALAAACSAAEGELASSPRGGQGNASGKDTDGTSGTLPAGPAGDQGSSAGTSTPGGSSNGVPTSGTGASDAGASGDASSEGGAAVAGCLATDFFCDDFDSYALGNATSTKWTNDLANGTLTIDDTRARAGKSLKVHTNGNGRALMRINAFAPTNNSFYGRMRLWVNELPSAPNYAHYTLVEAAGTGNSTLVRPVGGQFIAGAGNKKMWGVGSDQGPTGDWTRWKETAVAEPQKWVCMEWQLDATDNTVRIWIDGVAKPEMTVSTKDHDGNKAQDFVFPKFDKIAVGWWLYQANPTPAMFDLWIDDLTLRSTRVGCQ
jgi:hypothetical protein